MEISISVICCSLLYSIMVAIVYFSKRKINTVENKIYSFLMKINVFGLLLELGSAFFIAFQDVSPFYATMMVLVNKAFLIYLLVWVFTFTFYIFYISFSRRENFKEKMMRNKGWIYLFISISFLLILLLVINLPLYYYYDGNYIYSYGPATDILLWIGGLCIILDNVCVFKNIKKIATKKYYPLFILILLMIFVAILRKVNPGITIINSVFAFVTVLMYFTIENPDLQLVEELVRNRELTEKSIEEKSSFLFKMSQEVRTPVKSIIHNLNQYKSTIDNELREMYIENISDNANTLTFTVNNILDISTMDVNNIKVVNTSYHTKTFFEDIKRKALTEARKKNLEFGYVVTDNLPKVLYGDTVKLKQCLMAIILNAIKHTNSGFVDVEVNTIVRYDVCRLIILIKDSGVGMSLEKINEILSKTGALTKIELAKLNQLDVDLHVALKILKVLDGMVHIKSKIDEGTEFRIVIDQKIDVSYENYLDTKKYDFSQGNRILLVDDDIYFLNQLENLFSTGSNVVNTVMLGNECIDKIKMKEKYDLIIVDDELRSLNALPLLQELKKDKNFKIPVVVMLEKNKEFMKSQYIKDGFDDYLLKNDLEDEVKRIYQKYF